MPGMLAKMLTFFFVVLAWVPFRATDWQQTKAIYRALFMPDSMRIHFDCKYYLFLAVGAVIIAFAPTVTDMQKRFRPTWINALVAAILFIVSMFFFVKVSPFIYFNF